MGHLFFERLFVTTAYVQQGKIVETVFSGKGQPR